VLHKVQWSYSTAILPFRNYFCKALCFGGDDPWVTYVIDEALLQLNGHINVQSTRYWSVDKPGLINELSSCDINFVYSGLYVQQQ